MIPSLVASEIREALVDYLATTFSLCDDDVSTALGDFLTDPADGIFRGPYLRVRTPFRSVDSSWDSPLGWLPPGFLPYEHQAAAFERLTTVAGHKPEPTLVTTGTGSGKTECFLMPVLDHCARQRAAGTAGIKALILYPMNALATDQAGRIAAMINDHPHLGGLTAGLYIGENGPNSSMGEDHLIDDRHTLRASPPDILLTNYKMLDFLLLRRADHDLWATNAADTLRYVVLDEFHTYDGAQGTDVAMLLRRLGATLGMATAERPLGGAAPVATSATLGTEASAIGELREFAGKVFGVPFDADSVIGESRQTIDEACAPTDRTLPIPSIAELAPFADLTGDGGDTDAIVAAFCRISPGGSVPDNPVVLGEVLLSHPLTKEVLAAVAERPRSISDAVTEIVKRTPEWSAAALTDAPGVARALGAYLSLLSIARRQVGSRTVPLFSVEVQLWVREISRLLRAVQDETKFRWTDTPVVAGLPEAADDEGVDEPDEHGAGDVLAAADADDGAAAAPLVAGVAELELPAIYCRKCGHAGWMAIASELHDTLLVNPANVYRASFERSPSIRALLRANPADPRAMFLDPAARRIEARPNERTIPVYVTANEDAAKQQRCPACDERDAIRFIGLAVASLASVSINTMFGSPNVADDEQKLLAFTDSVQDASHRAAFFGGRTHRFNLRSVMSAALQGAGDAGLTVADLGDELAATGVTARDRYGLVPPDLQRDAQLKSIWSDEPEPAALKVLAARLGFEADLEFGLRSRVGRTLEQSVAAVARIDLGDPDEVRSLAIEALRDELGDVGDEALAGIDAYLLGLADRVRGAGAILNPLLIPFVSEGGKQWFIWGGRPHGLPPFTPDQGRPTFATTAPKSDFDSLTTVGQNPTWYLDWATRSLGLEPAAAAAVNRRVLSTLAETGDAVVRVDATGGSRVFGLDRRAVRVLDIDDHELADAVLRCDLCSGIHVVAPVDHGRWIGVPCRRYRCPGHYQPTIVRDPGYYRRFYRQGATRRVVTGEHTGLLNRADREALETAFKNGTAPDAPNVLTATPTLEMGIDIGDLSAVMLTSVPRNPASYIQRVGRAGRATGNALVTTFVRSDTHGLYYLAEPEAMLAGTVRPPNCYLEATETLRRQYVAYLIDRMADRAINADPPQEQIGAVLADPFAPESLFRTIIDASTGEPHHVEAFIALFGTHLADPAVTNLRTFAAGGIDPHLRDAVDLWFARRKELELRRDRLNSSIKRLEDLGINNEDDEEALRSLKGQRSAVVKLLKDHRNEYWVSALERLGVLPNYTLVDDTTLLQAALWSRDEDDGYNTETFEYARGGRMALVEFAPGNTFYANGHRHYIDSLEIGSSEEPLYEHWRLCPECTYAGVEVPDHPTMQCPRCGTSAIADVGARKTVLRLRTALSSGSEESARVFDESDERTRERYEVITLVDPDPKEITGAWLLGDQTFGAELCTSTHLRTFNLGISGRPSQPVPIAGSSEDVSFFTTCRQCGAVRDARNDRRGARPDLLHQGWCKVRSGAEKEQWDPLVLLHELTTEAIRFLVPVSMFEVDERLASFKAALLLGIRAELGGNPDHLTITPAHAPNNDGQGRRRFLVLYDQVPGGTGYLGPLADPERIHSILLAARNLISKCPCRDDGRSACHRCLLGVVDRWEYELVSRSLAKETLDDLLADWVEPETVETIGGASIAKVEESELERRFKVALREWAEHESRDDVEVTFTRVPGIGKFDAFELAIAFDKEVVRYRFDEQAGVSTTPSTIPDFVITRMDRPGKKIAVYLDGRQFHASVQNNNIAADSRKRDGVRSAGMLVWNLSWPDVEEFHKAVTAEIPRAAADRSLLTTAARTQANAVQHGVGGEYAVSALEQNPVALLLDYLARPETEHWRRAALSAVSGAGLSSDPAPIDASGLTTALDTALAAQHVGATPPAGAVVASVAAYVTPGGLPISLFLDMANPNLERWTAVAVLPDDDASIASSEHAARWSDWLAWANLLQFLGLPEDSTAGIIAGSSQATSGDHDDLWLRHVASSSGGSVPTQTTDVAAAAVALTAEQEEELDFLSTSVQELVGAAMRSGFVDLVVGYELGGEPIEAAWPDQKVAVLLDGQSVPPGWDARPVQDWTLDALLAALGPGATNPTENP